MNKKYFLITAVTLIAGASLAFAFAGQKNTDEPSGITEKISGTAPEGEFQWYSVKDALAMNKLSGKKIYIDTYTSWCGPCKMMEANTFSNPTIQKLLSEYFIPAKFNAESADTIVFNGITYLNKNYSTTPRTSTHEFAKFIAATNSGLAYPTSVFLDENLKRIDAIAGALTAYQLEPILVYYGSGVNKDMDWDSFLKTFKSEITQ